MKKIKKPRLTDFLRELFSSLRLQILSEDKRNHVRWKTYIGQMK
jgi:hypothetical protein